MPPEQREVHTVVVDAGHGGQDPGTSHHQLREKDLTLDIARRLSEQLNTEGFTARLTRDRDEFIPLSDRVAIANRLQADLFVSVHINANRNRQVSGVEVYYPRESIVDPTLPFPPSVQPEDVALPTTAIKQILWDLVLSRTRRQSVRLALHLCRALRSRLKTTCRGIHGARFVVLREAMMPAVLVEVGYVSNQFDAQRLGDSTYRQQIAEAITDGLLAYVRELGYEHL